MDVRRRTLSSTAVVGSIQSRGGYSCVHHDIEEDTTATTIGDVLQQSSSGLLESRQLRLSCHHRSKTLRSTQRAEEEYHSQ